MALARPQLEPLSPTTAAFGTCAGITTAACIGQFQNCLSEASYAANPSGPNAAYVPSAIANGQPIESGLLAPNYRSPQSLQMNVGFQRELRAGMVLSVDYLRNVGTHYLLDLDVNQTGATAYFNLAAAQSAIANTNAGFGCGASFSLAATQLRYSSGRGNRQLLPEWFGFSGQYRHGRGIRHLPGRPAVCVRRQKSERRCGWSCTHRSVARSTTVWTSSWSRTSRIRSAAYATLTSRRPDTLSRFNNAGSGSSNSAVSGGDQDFLTNGPWTTSTRCATPVLRRSIVPTRLASVDMRTCPRASEWESFPTSGRPWPLLRRSRWTHTVSAIFQNDYNGDGTNSDPLPRSVSGGCGTFGGDVSLHDLQRGCFRALTQSGSLANAVNTYNSAIAGNPTPAGQLLINSGLFTLAQLQAVTIINGQPVVFGGVTQGILPVVPGQVNMGWFKGTDIKLSWVGHIKERFTIEPSVGFFNVFNFANFDSAGNALVGTLSELRVQSAERPRLAVRIASELAAALSTSVRLA